MVDVGLRDKRKNPGWFPVLAYKTSRGAGALTVAGQWRSFTAFPSILAIAVVGDAARRMSGHYAMEQFSVTSIFYLGCQRRSQRVQASPI